METGPGARLQGFYSPQPAGQSRGLALILHGWLGSAQANYIITLGISLYRRGFAIFRLNLRDHGDTHHLNPGVFRGDLLDEVVDAARQIAALEADKPFHIIGASLGGNFALRLAWRHSQSPLPNLAHTVALNPPLDPYRTTLNLDRSWLYLRYFRRKWRRSLRQKANLFPELYDFSGALAAKSCMAMTERFVRDCSPYPNARAYFEHYTIRPEMMAALTSSTTMVTAADDPIVPAGDFYPFQTVSPYLRVSIQPYGGHVGFIQFFPVRYWLPEAVLAILENN